MQSTIHHADALRVRSGSLVRAGTNNCVQHAPIILRLLCPSGCVLQAVSFRLCPSGCVSFRPCVLQVVNSSLVRMLITMRKKPASSADAHVTSGTLSGNTLGLKLKATASGFLTNCTSGDQPLTKTAMKKVHANSHYCVIIKGLIRCVLQLNRKRMRKDARKEWLANNRKQGAVAENSLDEQSRSDVAAD